MSFNILFYKMNVIIMFVGNDFRKNYIKYENKCD